MSVSDNIDAKDVALHMAENRIRALVADVERLTRERDAMLNVYRQVIGRNDATAMEAVMHIDNVLNNARTDAGTAARERDEALASVNALDTWIENVATDEQLDAPVQALGGATGRALLRCLRKDAARNARVDDLRAALAALPTPPEEADRA